MKSRRDIDKENKKIIKREENVMPGSRSILTQNMKRHIVALIDERIKELHVTKEDFSELKTIVKEIAKSQTELIQIQKQTDRRIGELAEAQKQTDRRIGELAEAQKQTDRRIGELAEAQKQTDRRIGELAEAQKQTEQRIDTLTEKIEQLAEAQRQTEVELKKLTVEFYGAKVELGGLSRSFSYAFENEAYRYLPKVLKEKYGYEVLERILRADIGGKEINFFGKAKKNDKEVYIVGESKLRIESDWRMDAFYELEEKVDAVKSEFGDVPIVRLLVTHYAKNSIIAEAKRRGVIIVQSFEW